MRLFYPREEQTTVNVPKFTDDKFIPRNNYYVVTNGTVFNSYSLKAITGNQKDPLIRLEENPPVLLEGYAIIGRKIYQVSVQDLFRKVVRKSKEIKLGDLVGIYNIDAGSDSNADSSNVAEALGLTTGPTSDKQGIINSVELEISKNANAAWEEQMRALLHSEAEEEEWEIEDSA